jgi:RNA polymerase sigma-70 factor (ECF subfamily)
MVFSAAMRLLASQAEAKDVAQEVFLRAFEHFPELRDNPRAAGWLRTVAVNLSLNHLSRYRSRWTFFSELFHGDDSPSQPEPASTQDVRAEVSALDRRQLVEDALRKLPPSQRTPLVLFHMEGMRYEEIAARLGISLGKVKTDIFRGREALRKTLEPELREGLTL